MGLMNRVGSRVRLNFTRYTAASAIATTVTQIVLLALSLLATMPAAAASTVAFAAGAVPQFLIIRRWAFGGLPRQVVTFVVITVITGLASVSMVAMVDVLVGPGIADKETRAIALNLGYLLGGAPIFLAKFLVLDRVFFLQGSALRSVGGRQLHEGARGEAGRARGDVVVSLVRPRWAGDVQVGPWQAVGELAEERGGHDAAGSRRALAHIGDVTGHGLGELGGEAVDVVGQRHAPPRLAGPFAS